MTRNTKRSLSPDIEHRSTKRRKPYDSSGHIEYSTRDIPWEEQRQLPKRFHEHGEGFWPALRIVEERGTGRKREYLIEWEEHPKTLEQFEPTWTPAADTNTPLRQEWEKKKQTRAGPVDLSTSTPSTASSSRNTRTRTVLEARRAKSRRIVPDSSEDFADTADVHEHSEISRTPTLIGSPKSIDTSTALEIQETQQPSLVQRVSVNLPPSPIDKSDYESYRESQFSSRSFPFYSNSPVHNSTYIASPSREQRQNSTGSYLSTSPLALASSSSQRFISARQSRVPSRILRYSAVEDPPGAVDLARTSLQGTPNSKADSPISRKSSDQRNTSKDQSLNRSFFKSRVSLTHTTSELQPIQSEDFSYAPIQTVLSSDTEPSPRFQTQVPPSSYSFTPAQPRSIRHRGNPESSEGRLHLRQSASSTKMMARATRSSPRLQVATPVLSSTSPRVAVRGNSSRTRTSGNAPEISSPLAATMPEIPDDVSPLFENRMSDDGDVANDGLGLQHTDLNTLIAPNTIQPESMHIVTNGIPHGSSQQSSADGMTFETAPIPIQESIEEEPASSNEDGSLESKASSSQQSLDREQLIRQQDGLLIPDFPVLGPDEYCLALPAEGKVQAIYTQIIKLKRKAILKFIKRRGSVNLASTSATKTIERNDMIELIQRLHDTTTHIDLGLPGIPTQYTLPSSEHAAYAEYAGSKFVFLGCLVDDLMRRDCTVAIMAQSATQDLLEEYLLMKHVDVRRYDRTRRALTDSQSQTASLKVELLCTKASSPMSLSRKPVLVIAFDASFETLDPQLQHLRAQFSGQLPVLHLMVTNSSEHVERCLPTSMPSPIRLRLLVRSTYQAHQNLGGPPTYVEDPSDLPPGRPMDMLEFGKAIRKSPQRKLAMLAAIVANTALSDDFAENWTLKSMPELALETLDETPPSSKQSRGTSSTRRARSQTPMSRVASQRRGRSQTPGSAVGTPRTRKRLLEPETGSNMAKRQRMTPIGEVQTGELDPTHHRLEELVRELDALRSELATEKQARQVAEAARVAAEMKQHEWQTSLAALQHRYEKRVKKSHELSKEHRKLSTAIDNSKARIEKLNADNGLLKNQLTEAKTSLASAREDVKSVGGDVAALETAREEARTAASKASSLEKSLNNIKRDFEFVRSQYQEASTKAAELASQVTTLEQQNASLAKDASGEKRRLKELSIANTSAQHLSTITRLEQEKNHRDVLLKKLEDELKMAKRNRGVQTRGSSVQPGSPAPRSRQASPAAHLGPPSGSRASVLRHER